jgi:hypothetical protein
MAYEAEISRSNPTALVILLDQSSSMSDPMTGGQDAKAAEAARVVNRFLAELTIKCAKSEGLYDYYYVAVLGYGESVGSAFGSALAGSDLQPISRIGDSPLRLDHVKKKVPDGAGGLVEESTDMPIWVEAKADGMTPMCQALTATRNMLADWLQAHPSSYPPTVINVTDGEANDGDPTVPASSLTDLASDDGNVLLFNCHTSSKRGVTVPFPSSSEGLIDQFAKQLFGMSSELPATQLDAAKAEGFNVMPGSRGFMFNAGLEDLIKFIDIGSRSSQLR